MTVHNEGFEYNILGCSVRIKPDETERDNALKAIETVNTEIEKLRRANSKLSDLDVAVLVSLKLASEKQDVEQEYKENVFSLKSGINEALNFIEEVSPGSMQPNQSASE
jgi:cell division protein ZapA (FtsZ GTPase activity inhibitor)